jgi:phosphoribosylamine--glycine ligase
MRILVIGSGAREHAIAWKLAAEPTVSAVVCTPGNPGIASVARCVPGDVSDPLQMLAIAEREQVDLTVVGPELPLSLGVTDLFISARRPILGPTRAAAALEWSKSFAKEFMARHAVPTARFAVCDSAESALAFVARGAFGYPIVVKADGLAAGKGVVIAGDRAEAETAVRQAMIDHTFGAAGERVVFEEFLTGEEASYFVLADGTACLPLSSAQDHKRIFDNDRGPNTGGMGAFSPSPLLTADVERQVLDRIVHPVLSGMQAEGHPYSGFLYVGLMLTAEGPQVIEFNVRFGDPEAQVVLPMLDENLSALLWAAATHELPSRAARFRDAPHVGVVLASAGYPERTDNGRVISGLEAAATEPHALVFHAGTRQADDAVVTSGGRVLTVVGRGPSHREAIDAAYRALGHIHFEGMQYRTDIGQKALAALGLNARA